MLLLLAMLLLLLAMLLLLLAMLLLLLAAAVPAARPRGSGSPAGAA
jgi:hypothetical protein